MVICAGRAAERQAGTAINRALGWTSDVPSLLLLSLSLSAPLPSPGARVCTYSLAVAAAHKGRGGHGRRDATQRAGRGI